jgi:hypothetical protein
MTPNLLRAFPTEADRSAGALTADEVRQVLAWYLAPWEVAQLARTAKGQTMAADVIADLISTQRGAAGGGTVCQATRKGVQVRLHDPDAQGGYRTGLIRWRLLQRVVADGVTAERLAALNTALRDKKPIVARRAAHAIVTAGPPVTQLDLLDQLHRVGNVEQGARGSAGGGRS